MISGTQNYGKKPQLLRFIRRIQLQPTLIQAIIFTGLFVLVSAVDLAVDYDLSLTTLYLIPTLYATWFIGRRRGYGSCAASALVWVIQPDDIALVVLKVRPKPEDQEDQKTECG